MCETQRIIYENHFKKCHICLKSPSENALVAFNLNVLLTILLK